MEELPPEILFLIGGNLDVDSLLNLCVTQKRFTFLCEDINGPLWTELLVRDFPEVIYTGVEDPTSKKDLYFKLRNVDYWKNLISKGEMNLRYAYLKGSDLQNENLQNANLKFANLKGVNLEGATLEGANLEGANLEGATLRYAILLYANLRGATLEGATLEGATLLYATLQDATLQDATLQNATLLYANLQNINQDLVSSK